MALLFPECPSNSPEVASKSRLPVSGLHRHDECERPRPITRAVNTTDDRFFLIHSQPFFSVPFQRLKFIFVVVDFSAAYRSYECQDAGGNVDGIHRDVVRDVIRHVGKFAGWMDGDGVEDGGTRGTCCSYEC
jgi:hypothetical protein